MLLTRESAGCCLGTEEEEERLRSLTSWRRQGDSKGKPEGDREEWKKWTGVWHSSALGSDPD